MDPEAPDEPSREELESRVEQLEQTVSKMLPDRRGVLKGLGAAALGGAAVGGSTGGASGQSGPAGQVGTDSNPVDAKTWDLDVANEVVTDLPMGGNGITDAGSVGTDEITGSVAPSPITNLAGTGLEVDAEGNLIAPSDGSGSVTGSALTVDTSFGDGAWCWFGGPIGVYDSQSDKTFMAWLTSNGDAVAGSYDHSTETTTTTTLQASLQVDDHANPAILFRDDGRLTYFYSAHQGGTMYYRTTSSARDISTFDTEQSISPSAEHDYENPRQRSSDGRIYNFYRADTHPVYIYSDDGAGTWSSASDLVTTSEDFVYHQFSEMTAGGVSCAFSKTLAGERNEDGSRDVAYARYNTGDDTLYDAAGNSLGSPPLDITNLELVFDSSAQGLDAWVWDVAYHGGNPEIVWATKPTGSYTDHDYYWARWGGSSWITTKVADAGQHITDGTNNQRFYSGGISLDSEIPGRVYYSYCPSDSESHTYVAETSDAGSTWNKDLISAVNETQARPMVPNNRNSEIPCLWWRGTYNDFVDYNTDAISGFGAGPAVGLSSSDGGSSGSTTTTRGFESGDFSNWTLADSGGFSIVQSPVYEGTYAAQSTESGVSSMSATVTADAYSSLSFATYNDTAALAEARPIVKFKDGGASGTEIIDLAIDDGGVVGDSGSVIINEGSGYVDTGVNITGGTWYRHDFNNVDWSNNQFDYVLTDGSGTQVHSSTYSFKNSASQIDAAFMKLNPELVTVDSFEFTT